MSVQLNPYLHFNGNAEEVAHFYGKVFGVEPTISRYGDDAAAMEHTDEKYKNNVMHADLQSDDIRLMLSDSGPMGEGTVGTNFSVSLSGDDETQLTEYFTKLSEGGKIDVPLAMASWGDSFGMLHDKFGISWFVNITGTKE
jgi:PhnB protein